MAMAPPANANANANADANANANADQKVQQYENFINDVLKRDLQLETRTDELQRL